MPTRPTLPTLGLLTALVAPVAATAPIHPPKEATAVFAGGCFWGVEMVFEHLRGVRSATAGYARWGTPGQTASGQIPVEAVKVVYDPTRLSYRQLLEVFFAVAHDPTSRDRQGPDAGPEYRAIVFVADPAERRTADEYLAELTGRKAFAGPIVTEVQPLGDFRVAETFHQDFARRNPTAPYIVVNDLPKLARLRRAFPGLYREDWGERGETTGGRDG